jgi:hypothetical protein
MARHFTRNPIVPVYILLAKWGGSMLSNGTAPPVNGALPRNCLSNVPKYGANKVRQNRPQRHARRKDRNYFARRQCDWCFGHAGSLRVPCAKAIGHRSTIASLAGRSEIKAWPLVGPSGKLRSGARTTSRLRRLPVQSGRLPIHSGLPLKRVHGVVAAADSINPYDSFHCASVFSSATVESRLPQLLCRKLTLRRLLPIRPG